MGDNFTGREHDHDVLENEELVTEVINNLNTIATSGVSAAYDKIKEAVTALNNVKGLSEYVGTVSESQLESIFSGEGGVVESIKALATAMQQSADSIKEYDESVWYEKAGSTILMGLAKTGEGLLNILEDLGDGVFSVVGFVTNDWFGTGGISNLVKRELSHEVFEGFYNSDLAKKSSFTEDSGLAGGIKIASTTAGYIAIAACTAGVGTGLAGTGGAAATFASSTTIANTVIAGVAGLGSGTETGLREGKGFYEAFATNGLSQAAINGGIAFAAGKFGEHLAKAKAIKAAKADVSAAKTAVSEADDAFSAAVKERAEASTRFSKAKEAFENEFKTLSDKTSALAEKNAAKVALDKANANWLNTKMASSEAHNLLSSAETKLAETSAAKAATFQGYNDKISNKFFEKGKQAGSNWRELGFAQGTKANASGVVGDVVGGVKTVAKTVTKPVIHPVQTFKAAGNAVKNVVVHPVQTAKSIPSGIVNVAKTVNPVTTVASVPGLVSSTGTSVYRELRQESNIDNSMYNVSNATSKNISSYNDQNDISRRINESFGGGQSSNPTPTNSPSNSTPTPTNTGGSTNGGSTSGGNTYSGNTSSGSTSSGSTSGGSPTYQSPVSQSSDTTAQLKKTAEEKVVDPVKEISKTTPATTTPETTTPESTTPTDTTYQTPQQESPAAVVTVPSNDGGYYDTTYHTGGGYSGEGFTPADVGDELNSLNTDTLNPLDETLLENSASIDEIVKGSKYTKIPSSSKPITTTTSTGSGSSSVIPIAAGLSAAAAAGIGAKAYMDRKKNNDFDDEDDDFETEEWSGDDESVNVDYDDSSDTQLDNDDDYSYQAEPEEKYGARSNEELADLQ